MKSMTGFGKATKANAAYELTVELRSVNNRYLDLNIRLPKEFSALENKIRQTAKKELARGKVNVFVNLEKHGSHSDAVIDPALTKKLYSELQEIHNSLDLKEPVTLSHLLEYFPLSDTGKIDLEEKGFEALLMPALHEALGNLNEMRAGEGKHLEEDMRERIRLISTLTEEVKQKAASNVQLVFDRLVENVKMLIGEQKLNTDRLEQEIALISDKVDIPKNVYAWTAILNCLCKQ